MLGLANLLYQDTLHTVHSIVSHRRDHSSEVCKLFHYFTSIKSHLISVTFIHSSQQSLVWTE